MATVLDTATCANLEEVAEVVEHFVKVATAFGHTGLAVATTTEVSLALIRDERTKLITIKIVAAA